MVTYYLLFVMELKLRRVHFAGCTPHPHERWMNQIARNLTDIYDGFLLGECFLLMDRDDKFCKSFRELLKNEGVKSLRLPPRSPNLNANLERYFRSLKHECLSRMIFFGEKSLLRATDSFIRHYHEERNHQGLANRIIEPGEEVGQSDRDIQCREQLGGLLRYYYRQAA